MRRKIAAVVLAMILGVPAFGVTAFAAGCNHHNTCELRMIRYEFSYVNPVEHCVEVAEEHFCFGCQEIHEFVYYFHEGHTYTLDINTEMLVCDFCGDSYHY